MARPKKMQSKRKRCRNVENEITPKKHRNALTPLTPRVHLSNCKFKDIMQKALNQNINEDLNTVSRKKFDVSVLKTKKQGSQSRDIEESTLSKDVNDVSFNTDQVNNNNNESFNTVIETGTTFDVHVNERVNKEEITTLELDNNLEPSLKRVRRNIFGDKHAITSGFGVLSDTGVAIDDIETVTSFDINVNQRENKEKITTNLRGLSLHFGSNLEPSMKRVRRNIFGHKHASTSGFGVLSDTDDAEDTNSSGSNFTLSSDDSSEENYLNTEDDAQHNNKNNLIGSSIDSEEQERKIIKCKKNFCLFCKQLFAQLPRHLEMVHKDEEDVKKFMFLPKGNDERKKYLDDIRKRGNFEYNRNTLYNNGKIITCRQIQNKQKIEQFSCCPECKGFYTKTTLRKHYIHCSSKILKGDRSVLVRGRKMLGNIHKCASDVLKNDVFPILREDEVTQSIRYDELIIKFANKLCEKYRSKHHHKMIRSRLRLIGRFLIDMKSTDSTILDMKSVFVPQRYDQVIHSVNRVAKLNNDIVKYQSPSTASELGTLLKKMGRTLISECIKYEDAKKKNETENFLLLLQEDYGISINKTVRENQFEQKRMKKTVLPTMEDIKCLNTYLSENRDKLFKKLSECFDFKIWKELSGFVLISVLVFNRRRAGEVERMTVKDVLNYEEVNENVDADIYNSLTLQSKQAAKHYVRIVIRGKLCRTVPVLLSTDLLDCIKLLLHHRNNANISHKNPYLFALPHSSIKHQHLEACTLLRKFSTLCGAKKPESLRGTHLRKHIATSSVLLNLKETEVSDLANYMGHTDKIHKDHYRMPIATRDITIMSRLLQLAQGQYDNDEESDSDVNDTQTPKIFENLTLTTDASYTDVNDPNQSSKNFENLTLTRDASFSSELCFRNRVIRRPWRTPETKAAKEAFKTYINNGTLPSLQQCSKIRIINPDLEKRTPQQLKAWVNNYFNKKQCFKKPGSNNEYTRMSWNTPERSTMRKTFGIHLQDKILPSASECAQAIEQNATLSNRTVKQVKAWVFNEINRRRKEI